MKKVFLLSFVCALLFNCTNRNDDEPTATDCVQITCTEIFATIIVSVKDASGVAIPLDSFEVIDKNSSEDITIDLNTDDFQTAQQSGNYPLCNDLQVAENQNTHRTVVFKGFIDNAKIAEGEFIVDTDCCHVSLQSGIAEIIVN